MEDEEIVESKMINGVKYDIVKVSQDDEFLYYDVQVHATKKSIPYREPFYKYPRWQEIIEVIEGLA